MQYFSFLKYLSLGYKSQKFIKRYFFTLIFANFKILIIKTQNVSAARQPNQLNLEFGIWNFGTGIGIALI